MLITIPDVLTVGEVAQARAARDAGRFPFMKATIYHNPACDEQLIDAMLAHPILINRPIVVTPLGARLCRPSETVLEILPKA